MDPLDEACDELVALSIRVTGYSRRTKSGKTVRVSGYQRKGISEWLSEPGWPWEVDELLPKRVTATPVYTSTKAKKTLTATKLQQRVAQIDKEMEALKRRRAALQAQIDSEVSRLVSMSQMFG